MSLRGARVSSIAKLTMKIIQMSVPILSNRVLEPRPLSPLGGRALRRMG